MDGPAGAADARASHQLLVVATMRQLAKPATVSHVSAAAMHGLPVWPDALTRVHLTRPDAQGRVRSSMHLHQVDLPAEETTLIDGCSVTSLARTVVDVARTEGFVRSVAAADAALARGLDAAEAPERDRRPSASSRGGTSAPRRRLCRRPAVRASVSRAVGWSSTSTAYRRRRCSTRCATSWGRFLGRSDFCWESRRVIGEFDGKVKYAALLRPGQSPSDVVVAGEGPRRRHPGPRVAGDAMDLGGDLQPGRSSLRRLKRALAVRI